MKYTNGFLRTSRTGKYVGVLKYRDPAGEWRQVTKTFSQDRRASELEFALWRGKMAADAAAWPGTADAGEADAGARGTFPTLSPTVEEAVRACLATQLARRRIERSTHDMQLAYVERELFPELGAVPLVELTPAIVQAWLDRICLGISSGSARIPFSVLSKTCGRAVREGVIARNPLDLVDPPTRAKPTRAYLPPTSVALLERALDERWGPEHALTCATRLALYAGLRAGEACGLRWRDVEVGQLASVAKCPTGRLRVVTSIGRTLSGCYVKGPKNASSAREFPIVPQLAHQLAARREWVRATVDGGPSGSWFVCGDRDEPLSPHVLSHTFAKFCERAGVTDNNGRRATFHMLRHTFATRAVRAGVDVRTLADLLGHARADVTLNVYAASGEDAKLAATSRLGAAFADGRGA